MFEEGFGYHGNKYDVIKCLKGNLSILGIRQSIICFSNYLLKHDFFLFNCPDTYKRCKKPFRA